jgi:hypothetical protein
VWVAMAVIDVLLKVELVVVAVGWQVWMSLWLGDVRLELVDVAWKRSV